MVNVVGSFIMGVLMGLLDKLLIVNTEIKLLFTIGFCGGFTTFSAFAADNLNLLQTGNTTLAIANIAANVSLSIVMLWLGVLLVK